MPRLQNAEVLCVEDIFKDKYVIPLYQRNFAWGEEQISRLMQDLFESMEAGDSRFYLGSLVVIERNDGMLEVIDGQQRLTMLSILSACLNLGIHTDLHYDSRPEVEEFFKSLQNNNLPENRLDSSVGHFYEAKELVETVQLEVKTEETKNIRSNTELKQELAKYILSSVRLVREIMPEDTDVATYFEIMNNRGEQLQEHEIVKGLLLSKLHDIGQDKYINVCSHIWDACSQMDIRLQKSFNSNMRKDIFGSQYETIQLKGHATDADFGKRNVELLDKLCAKDTSNDKKSIDTILKETNVYPVYKIDGSGEYIKESKEESIIDFPNFLMHVFKLFYSIDGLDIQLSDKYLLDVYEKLDDKIEPVDFFLRLLYCRYIFDRFMVKSEITNNDQSREWTLDRAKASISNERTNLYFASTFDDTDTQETVIYALSCLQVSFRQRPYKNFLQVILSWFVKEDVDKVEQSYVKRLHELMVSEFDRCSKNYIGISEYTSSLQGTNVSHYLFNFADYLYWYLKKRNGHNGISNELNDELELIDYDTDFRFLNRNSIEHHYPQKRKEEMESKEGVTYFDLNCLGNLYLVGKSTNSRLSDKAPIDKATLYDNRKNLPPTRQIIYAITRKKHAWGINEIKQHFKSFEELIGKRNEILNLQ